MGRDMKKLESARDKLKIYIETGARIEILSGDGLKKEDVIRGLKTAYDINNSLNICIPTIGGGDIRPLLMHDEKSFMSELGLNVLSAFLVIRYGAPLMATSGGGSIVCISSDAAKLVFPWLPAYTTSKCGLEGLVRASAEELARFKIRVNAVRPGLTRTDATNDLFNNPEIYKRFAEEKPLGRLGEPEDVSAGVRYLAGPESSWVTGQSIGIEGGNELRKAPDMAEMVKTIYGEEAFKQVLIAKAPIEDY